MTPNSKMHQRFQQLSRSAEPTAAAGLTISSSTEQGLIDLIKRPIASTETAAIGNARKEVQLREMLASLPVLEAWSLHKRLVSGAPNDPLVVAFQRLVIDRRQRLLQFLADARRRAALSRQAA